MYKKGNMYIDQDNETGKLVKASGMLRIYVKGLWSHKGERTHSIVPIQQLGTSVRLYTYMIYGIDEQQKQAWVLNRWLNKIASHIFYFPLKNFQEQCHIVFV